MPTAVLTGCNSGIGHETAQIALRNGWTVYALDIEYGDKLKTLHGPKCKVGRLDVTDTASIAEFKETLGNEPVDLLFNIAGIMAEPKTQDSRDTCSLPSIQRTFAVNAYGPFLLTQALLPNILVASSSPRRVAVVSSRVASMADNASGGAYAYRASKAAVNSFFKTFAVELKEHNVAVTILHPGFTNTNLGADIKNVPGVVEADVAAEALWKIVLNRGVEDTGKFWHREGYELPW